MNRSVALAGSAVIAVLGLSLPVAGSLAQPIQTFTKSDGSARSLLQPVHGCHPDYEWGWVREWHTKARHRHSQRYDCVPRGEGGGREYDRGDRYEDRGDRYEGPPAGWRRGGYAPGCMKVGPVWYCPPD